MDLYGFVQRSQSRLHSRRYDSASLPHVGLMSFFSWKLKFPYALTICWSLWRRIESGVLRSVTMATYSKVSTAAASLDRDPRSTGLESRVFLSAAATHQRTYTARIGQGTTSSTINETKPELHPTQDQVTKYAATTTHSDRATHFRSKYVICHIQVK